MSSGSDEVLQAVNRRAMEIVSLPENERSERYEIYRDAYKQAGLDSGMTDEQSDEAAAKMDEWIRSLVTMIETSGGGGGGTA